MIIHQPEIMHENGFTTVFSRFELTKKNGFFPELIWYRVPDAYGDFLTTQSDAFLVPGLLAGMYFGEDIEVRGVVSPKLAYQLEEYQYLLHYRFPKYQHPNRIQYERLAALDGNPKGVGASFSGGVDSLVTLWKHLPQNQPEKGFQITHTIFIDGFDLLKGEDRHYKFLYEKYDQALAEIGINLIPLKTNIVSITHKRLDIHIFYGPIIVATGLALSGGLCRFYAPSSGDYAMLNKKFWTADPLMDHLLSTDTLDVIHHGSTHLRVEKVEEIADWEVAQKILWVCEIHKFRKDTWNCSRCEKCIRTMIPIYALGLMNKFRTFETPFRTNRDGLWWARKFSTDRVYASEIFPFVKKHKPEWLPWLRAAAVLGTLRYWFFVKLVPGFLKKWLGRYGYFVNRNDAADAYEVPEITQFIQEHYDHSST